jgi:uncharacterized protein
VKDEKILEEALAKPDFLCESGSHLYGMVTPESDHDLRGFVCPPYPYLIGIKKFESKEFPGDKKIYSALYFLRLVLRGDPQTTELFFADEKHIVECSEIGRRILSLRDSLISNAIFGRIMGYSTGEWRKAMAVKLVSVKADKTKKLIINDIRTHWSLDKEKMDSIVDVLDSIDEKKLVSSMSGLGTKRKADVEEYGFCRKSAAHSIRLLNQLVEIMETGQITFPRPEASMLLDIRKGKYTKEELEEIHDEVVSKAEAAREKSVLPDKPNEKYIYLEYSEITKLLLLKMLNNN